MPRFKTVAIVGVGLIGGSIGLAVRERKLTTNVVGIGRHAPKLKKAKELGAITETSLTIEDGVEKADIVIVCTPVSDIAGHILQAAAAAPSTALLTDAGSTKRKLVADVEAAIGADKHFVGSHPLAGSEKTGVEHARPDLFNGKVVVVTPTRRTANSDMQAVADFWSGLGASVLIMTPDAHDRALASTSHLPHLVASAVAAKTAQVDLPVTAGGWRDVTRIAAGDPELWTQILLENREHVLKSLAGFEKTVAAFRTALERSDKRKLNQLLTEGKQVRDAVGN